MVSQPGGLIWSVHEAVGPGTRSGSRWLQGSFPRPADCCVLCPLLALRCPFRPVPAYVYVCSKYARLTLTARPHARVAYEEPPSAAAPVAVWLAFSGRSFSLSFVLANNISFWKEAKKDYNILWGFAFSWWCVGEALTSSCQAHLPSIDRLAGMTVCLCVFS